MRPLFSFLFWGIFLFLVWSYILRPILTKLPTSQPRRRADELVKDPVCQTYLPRSRALARTIHGTTRYFCSEECLRRYIAPPSIRGY